jgi:hypothetical protein
MCCPTTTILQKIFQVSIDTGDLPKDWRDANISSIFKKGDKHLPETYRPVSLTSVPCKLLEHIICRHLMKHLETNKILTNLNHGFRSGYSCESEETTVDEGVTQRTVLEPLMFRILCHINDLPDSVTSSFRLFTDDCLLYCTIKQEDDHQALQKDLRNATPYQSTKVQQDFIN